MSEISTNKFKRLLEEKQRLPEYKRLDIEPKEAGRSLLQNENGIPLISNSSNIEEIPLMNEISTKPVFVKAEKQTEKSDGFIPPKSNFVSVGRQRDHVWYDKKQEESTEEEIDVESLQGLDPLGVEGDQVKETRNVVQESVEVVKNSILVQLNDISSLNELNELKEHTFGQSGILTKLMLSAKNLGKNEAFIIGEIVANAASILSIEFDSKKYELINDGEEEADPDNSNLQEENENQFVSQALDLEEGSFAIYISNELYAIEESSEKAISCLSKIILGNDIDISSIKVLKRVPIDFGVIFKD